MIQIPHTWSGLIQITAVILACNLFVAGGTYFVSQYKNPTTRKENRVWVLLYIALTILFGSSWFFSRDLTTIATPTIIGAVITLFAVYQIATYNKLEKAGLEEDGWNGLIKLLLILVCFGFIGFGFYLMK